MWCRWLPPLREVFRCSLEEELAPAVEERGGRALWRETLLRVRETMSGVNSEEDPGLLLLLRTDVEEPP